jgi:error-prone DNA polymerase
MGFYHPATLVKDAQRRGIRFAPIDVQASDWDCTVTPDGAIRLGLRYVTGLREEIGKAIAATESRTTETGRHGDARGTETQDIAPRTSDSALRTSDCGLRTADFGLRTPICPKCGCDDGSMIEQGNDGGFCNVCSHQWSTPLPMLRRFASIDDLVRRIGLRRDEITVLAAVGALNSFGMDRRSALWQVERVVRPEGELFEEIACSRRSSAFAEASADRRSLGGGWSDRPWDGTSDPGETLSPLDAMTPSERLIADYAGSSLTIGPHPMSFRRHELSMRGVLRAMDLPRVRSGRRVRTAGMVITRQRPGTAKGFVFLTLEDETGVANIIVRPDFYDEAKMTLVEAPFLMIEGIVQTVDGVTAIRAERAVRLEGLSPDEAIESHDFH